MSIVKRLLAFSRKQLARRSDPVEEIVAKVQPVDETSMRLPRSFAHTMRQILSAESHNHAKVKG